MPKETDPLTMADATRIGTVPTSSAPKPHPHGRDLLVHALHWGICHQPEIHYGQVRPITRVKPGQLPALPWTTDCSGSGTTLCQYAGVPDPNGLGYNGQGFTGSLLNHLAHVRLGQLRPGDPVVFGCHSYPQGHHVCWVTRIEGRSASQVFCFSHGQEKGPFEITVAQEAQYQPDGLAGVVYLSLGI